MRPLISIALASSMMLASAARADTGQEVFDKKCSTCHGKDGKAQTKMGKEKQVSDLTDPAVQAKFTDDQAVKEVTDGNTEKKHPAFKDKLSADEIKSAVGAARAFGPKAAPPAK